MNQNRVVRTEFSRNEYLIFRLLQVVGAESPETIKVFGYSLRHRLWVRIHGLDDPTTAFVAELASAAKAEIGSWTK